MKKQRRGLDRYNVLHDGWRSLVNQSLKKIGFSHENGLIETGPFLGPNLKRELPRKNKILFFKFSPGNLLIILYQLPTFEAPSYNSF